MRVYLSAATAFLVRNRFYLVSLASLSLCFVAGCIAVSTAGESGGASESGEFSWWTIATAWGPLGYMVVWFMFRDKEDRKERREEREAQKQERRELSEQIKESAIAMTKLEVAITQSHANDEKNRQATYKLADAAQEIRVKIDGIYDGMNRGTRVMPKG